MSGFDMLSDLVAARGVFSFATLDEVSDWLEAHEGESIAQFDELCLLAGISAEEADYYLGVRCPYGLAGALFATASDWP